MSFHGTMRLYVHAIVGAASRLITAVPFNSTCRKADVSVNVVNRKIFRILAIKLTIKLTFQVLTAPIIAYKLTNVNDVQSFDRCTKT